MGEWYRRDIDGQIDGYLTVAQARALLADLRADGRPDVEGDLERGFAYIVLRAFDEAPIGRAHVYPVSAGQVPRARRDAAG